MATTTLRAPNDSPTAAAAAAERPRSADPGASTTPPRQVGLLGRLARCALENARTHGVAFAAGELLRMESLLCVLRAHQLATPVQARGDAYGAGLMLIELMIQREALERCRRKPVR